MTRNVALPERLLRAIVGIGLLGLYGALPGPWKYLTLLGLFPLGTALTGRCPVYSLTGRHRNPSAGSDPSVLP